MKNLFWALPLITIMVACGSTQEGSSSIKTTSTLRVLGNCGMCKDRIENALQYEKGVQYAEWDPHTQLLEVKYNTTKINLSQIEEVLANVGHDTDNVKAEDDVYNKLHHCCQYNRTIK